MQLDPRELSAIFADEMHNMGCRPAEPLGLAVSGGGDSIAMLHLVRRWAGASVDKIQVICIDHQLRNGSKSEADWVRAHCADIGVSCCVRVWANKPKQGNLQHQARHARRALIGDWARTKGLSHVLTGHTMDDQGETFLLRLARGSGVSGLSGILPVSQANGVHWLRPLLKVRRATLRDYLRAKDIKWLDDPSNEDTRFDRVKMRQAQPILDDLGLSTQKLAFATTQLQRARAALGAQLSTQLDQLARATPQGAVALDVKAFTELPDELRLRLLGHILRWINRADFPPRLDALYRLLDAALGGIKHNLAGVIGQSWQGQYRFYREFDALHLGDGDYDRRWYVQTPAASDISVRPLGDDLQQLDNWRGHHLPRAELAALPAVFGGDTVLATPLDTELPDKVSFELRGGTDSFAMMVATH